MNEWASESATNRIEFSILGVRAFANARARAKEAEVNERENGPEEEEEVERTHTLTTTSHEHRAWSTAERIGRDKKAAN